MMVLSATPARNYRFTAPVLFLLLQFAAISVYGQSQITRCGTFIKTPGEYVLANDLTDCGYGVIITGTHDVVLNLAGHRITGSSTTAGAGIKVQSGATRIRIQGPGVISNFSSQTSGGVLLYSSGAEEVTAVTCTNNNWGFVYSQGNARIHGNFATNNVDGVFALGAGGGAVEISDNLASGNTEDGIVTVSSGGEVRIMHNTVAYNGRYGILAEQGSMNNNIISNTSLGNASYDLFDGNRTCQNSWADNTFGTSNGPCIH